MPHYKAYDSFKTKKSIEKKKRAKEKASGKQIESDDFVVNAATEYGIVIAVRYDNAHVLYGDNVIIAKLRKDLNMICNQILFPGDKVVMENDNDTYVITHLVSRTTLLSRVKKDSTRLDDSVGLTKNIAANIDIAVIVVAAKEPPLHERFIDRYLMILQNSGIEAVLCLNKCELATDEIQRISIYRDINIPVIETSAREKIGIKDLKQCIRGKQAIFVGNSGVGKSSLINAIMEQDEIRTSSVSEKTKRGCHTTTASKHYIWDTNSSIIDTPGIRSLDISSFALSEIQDYFPEFDDWKKLCKYGDCIHFSEPYDSCFVKQGVCSGMISRKRYESYVRIIESMENRPFPNDFPKKED